MWAISPRLSFKVADSVGGDEEGADYTVRIVCAEVAVSAVESGINAIGTPRLEDVGTDPRIPQLLGQLQILLLADRAEFTSVFLEVVVEQMFGPEAGARCKYQARQSE
jgi:hypothetical protein